MLNKVTMDKLMEMKLTAMADAYYNQENDSKIAGVSFEDRFGMLVDIELLQPEEQPLEGAD